MCSQAIEGGVVHIGLAELTGGAAEFVDMETDEARASIQDGSLWKKLLKYRQSECGANHRRAMPPPDAPPR